jgi:hypothetical protein
MQRNLKSPHGGNEKSKIGPCISSFKVAILIIENEIVTFRFFFVSFGERGIFSLNFDSDNYFGKKKKIFFNKKKRVPSTSS